MKVKNLRFNYLYVGFAVMFIAASLQSCTITWISPYDEVTDTNLTSLHQYALSFIDTLLQTSGTADAALAKHQQTYNELNRQISQLEFRAGAMPNNEIIVKLIHQIRLSILGSGDSTQPKTSLLDLHSLNDRNKNLGPSKLALEVCRSNIDQTISAALALELYEKSGKTYNQ